MTHSYVRHDSHTPDQWRRWYRVANLIGCLKLQVIFRKRATQYRALLRKMTHEDKAPYDPTPPCIQSLFEMVHSYVWHDAFICVTWLIRVYDMTHSYAWHDSLICVTRLVDMCDMTHSYVWHDSFVCVTWLMHMCDMTHSCVRHDSHTPDKWRKWYLIFVRNGMGICDMAHSFVWHDSFVCATWLIHMCDMTHSYVWHDSHTPDKWRKWYSIFVRNGSRSQQPESGEDLCVCMYVWERESMCVWVGGFKIAHAAQIWCEYIYMCVCVCIRVCVCVRVSVRNGSWSQ